MTVTSGTFGAKIIQKRIFERLQPISSVFLPIAWDKLPFHKGLHHQNEAFPLWTERIKL